jgi:multimeric flavodoxin WrbA
MNIALIDAGPMGSGGRYDAYIGELVRQLGQRGHPVDHVRLPHLKLSHCIGCWSCWVQTPGRCSLRDDGSRVLRSYLASDLVVFATPLSLGFVSGMMKRMLDRLIPLFCPHIEIYRGECVHTRRYDRYPAVGCLLHRGDYDEEDVSVTREYFRRYAFHFQTDLALEASTALTPEEVCDAIDCL